MLKELEELEELVNNFAEKEYGVKSTKIKADEILKRVKKIDEGEDTEAFIYISDNGQSVNGTFPNIMCLLSILCQKLVENGMDKELVRRSVEIGLANEEEKLEMLKNTLTRFTKIMEEK